MIYFSKSKGKYYSPEGGECINCKNPIDRFMIHASFFDKREKWASNYCQRCFDNIRESSLVTQFKIVIIEDIPTDSILVPENPPELGKGELSVFEMADRQTQNEKVINNTIYANRISWEGASIGSMEYTKEKEPAQLTEKKFNALIEDMREE
jgi:hypothetical protein